jgi:hypothetical protein
MFDLRVIMTGICGYRPSDHGTDGIASEVVVFLPRADDPKAIIDGQPTEAHYAALLYSPDGATQKKLPVLGYEIELDLEGQGLPAGVKVDPSFEHNVVPVSALSTIARLDPDLDRDLSTQVEKLWARARFTSGSLLADQGTSEWDFVPPFAEIGRDHRQPLCNQVDLHVPKVERASVRYRRFGAQDWSSVRLAPNDEGCCCVVLANLEDLYDSDRGINVLECSIGQEPDTSTSDPDFRWSYCLLDDVASHVQKLGTLPVSGQKFAPHPHREPVLTKGSGPNCYGLRF